MRSCTPASTYRTTCSIGRGRDNISEVGIAKVLIRMGHNMSRNHVVAYLEEVTDNWPDLVVIKHVGGRSVSCGEVDLNH